MDIQLNQETLVSGGSAVIALCALFATVWQAYVTRRHNKLSVTPFLTTWIHSDGKNGEYAVDLVNNGVGPALIESVQIFVDGRECHGQSTQPAEMAVDLLFNDYEHESTHAYVAKGYMMPTKERVPIARICFTGQKKPPPDAIDAALKRSKILVKYKSIYNESKIFDSDKDYQ